MATIDLVKPRPDGEFLTLEEAAEWYDIGNSTLRKLAAAGQLTKHRRRGDKRLYLKVEELERELRPQPE
jgi:excisionase family DNA binding protein